MAFWSRQRQRCRVEKVGSAFYFISQGHAAKGRPRLWIRLVSDDRGFSAQPPRRNRANRCRVLGCALCFTPILCSKAHGELLSQLEFHRSCDRSKPCQRSRGLGGPCSAERRDLRIDQLRISRPRSGAADPASQKRVPIRGSSRLDGGKATDHLRSASRRRSRRYARRNLQRSRRATCHLRPYGARRRLVSSRGTRGSTSSGNLEP